MKITILYVFLLGASIFAGTYNDVYLDSLFSNTFNEKFKFDQMDQLMETINEQNHPRSEDALLEFITVNKRYGTWPYPYLAKRRSIKFISWINTNLNIIDKDHWIEICNAVEAASWKDKNLNQIMLENAINNDNSGIRTVLFNYYRKNSSYNDVVSFASSLSKESGIGARQFIYCALCRYKTPEFDTVLKVLLEEKKEIKALIFTLKYGFKKYSRYDLLPELINLSSKLESEKDVIKKGQYASLQKELGKTISYLEKKRDEKAPIGLPLDWGVEDLK